MGLCLVAAVLVVLAHSWLPAASEVARRAGRPKPIVEASPTTMLTPGPIPAPKNDRRLVVFLSARRLEVYKGQKFELSYSLGVGQEGWETPQGDFRVSQMFQNPIWQHPITKELVPPGPQNPLGSLWIGFWTDGRHQIGFHGTNEEELIGQAVSHGCLRMRNQDIEALYKLISLGTPVMVRP